MSHSQLKTVKQLLDERQLSPAEFGTLASIDRRVVQHLIAGQWTPSPTQRQRIAQALGTEIDQIAWGHSNPVDHMYGHGPQFGRSP